MNESEINSPESSDLADQVASLQRQVSLLLFVLIVVSGTLAVFLFYQSRIMGKDIQAIRPQAAPIIQAYNANHVNMEKLIQQLVTYGQTHPDFQPILQKYRIVAAPAPGNPAAKPAAKK